MFRKTLFLCFFIFLNYLLTAAKCECEVKKSVQGKIKDFLLCGYDKDTRPVISHTNTTTVNLFLNLRYLNYDDHSYTLNVDAWLPLSWEDHHLVWDPQDFEGVKEIHISGDEIWVPDISLYNKGDLAVGPRLFESSDCMLHYDGTVACLPIVEMDALCVPDITYWPYDTQKCTLKIGSWVHRGDELDFNPIRNGFVVPKTYVPNAEWKILNTTAERDPGIYLTNNSYPSVVYTFLIQRHSGAATATCVLPAIALMIMILLTGWLDPKSSDRIYLSALNIPCHLLYIQHVYWEIPYNGDTVPNIVLFFRDSMLMGVILLSETLFVRFLYDLNITTPSWLVSTLNILTNNRIGKYLISENNEKGSTSTHIENDEDGSNLVGDIKIDSKREWFIFGKLLDKICFISYIIIYFTFLIIYMPK